MLINDMGKDFKSQGSLLINCVLFFLTIESEFSDLPQTKYSDWYCDQRRNMTLIVKGCADAPTFGDSKSVFRFILRFGQFWP